MNKSELIEGLTREVRPERAAILAALAAKYQENPLTDTETGIVMDWPEDLWPKGLAEKLENLLAQDTD